MEVIRETLWKRCLSTPTKPPAKNSNICLSETAYQHKGTRKKCKKTNQAAIIQWQRQCLMYKPDRKPWPKSKTSDISKQIPVHCITPFCSDALVSPPNLYPPWWGGGFKPPLPPLMFRKNLLTFCNENVVWKKRIRQIWAKFSYKFTKMISHSDHLFFDLCGQIKEVIKDTEPELPKD